MTTFAEWLTATREKRGLSQRSLAAKAGITQPAIVKIEDGGGASAGMVKKLADALEVDAAEAFRVWATDVAAQQGVDLELEYVADPDTINVTVDGLQHLDTATKTIIAQQTKRVVEGMVEVNRQIRKQRSEGFAEDRYPETQGMPAARLVDTSEPYIVDVKPSDEPERKTVLGVRQRSPRPADANPLPED